MSVKYHWFGDSWVTGDELATPVEHRFSNLVSNHFDTVCVNLGVNGSNINALPLLFYQHLNNINSNDTVFFCLTSSIRTGFFDEHGVFRNILASSYPKHNVHLYSAQWFKYFDNPEQRMYNYDSIINLLWLWCTHRGTRCYFLNLFTTESDQMISCVPESAWLIPRNQCIAQCILTCIDNEYGSVITDDQPQLTEQQWQLQEAQVNKYIRPNYAHPNIAGHAEIANNLIKLIDERS
jgi:hypothetical protein